MKKIFVITVVFPGDEEKTAYIHNKFDIIKEYSVQNKKGVTMNVTYVVEAFESDIEDFYKLYSVSPSEDQLMDGDRNGSIEF